LLVLTTEKKKSDDDERLWERKRVLRTLRQPSASRHGDAWPDFEDGGPNPSTGQRWRRRAIE
jgi:hypothetical protein